MTPASVAGKRLKNSDCLNELPLSAAAVCCILGAKPTVPLTPVEMAKTLRVAFYPDIVRSPNLEEFLQRLRLSLLRCGATVMTYDEALAEGSDGRIGKGIVLIAPGEGERGNLAIDHVASLSSNTVVGIIDGTIPGLLESRLQKRLDALVRALVWYMAQVVIYVDDTSWTIGNMNGGIDTFSLESLEDRILNSLVPKLAAPIVPPQRDDFEMRKDPFDRSIPDYEAHLRDMLDGSDLWGKTGLLMSQTKMDELVFRSNKYRRIAAAFLNWRTGMSYGFLARQLPVKLWPAIDLEESPRLLRLLDWTEKDFYQVDGHTCVALKLNNRRFVVKIPDVSVLCTRSGCEKTRLDPSTDLLKLCLIDGHVIVGTSREIGQNGDCQPSFDTTTILAHAVGNAMVGSILEKLRPSSTFSRTLTRKGLALAHWHGFLRSSRMPAGYFFHGENNPPVSCSTPQAAIYALLGKLVVLQRSLETGVEYLGDVHVEPSHGTNMTGQSLVGLAQLVSGRECHD